ncbi:Integral membrane protein DUF95 [uncultured Eubacterium sp.]|nr:Integral membrane protein DUF95 [uncultured Eubacterium sp.]
MKRKIIKLTWIVALSLIVLTAVFGLYFYQNAESAEEVISMYLPKAQSVMNEDGTLSYLGIVMNNIFACAMCIAMGCVPFLFLPALSVLSNSMIIGALLGYGAAAGTMSPLPAIVFGLLPHGIFELPGFFLSMAMGIYLCRTLTMKLLGKAKEEKILTMLNHLAKTFVLVVIPLLIVAAVIECNFTPMILKAAGIHS